MCKVCDRENNDFVILNETEDFSFIEISLNKQGMLRVRLIDNQGRITSQDIINIEFCPICGRKMRYK
jgi:C4-type Zn-finger protein